MTAHITRLAVRTDCSCGHSSDDHTRSGVCLDDICECIVFTPKSAKARQAEPITSTHPIQKQRRPRSLPDAVRREAVVATNVTDAEADRVAEQAKRSMMTTAGWIRHVIIAALEQAEGRK